jgi:hypothetical protein
MFWLRAPLADTGDSVSSAHGGPVMRKQVIRQKGEIGAAICIEASRLAHSGRDGHRLLEFCRPVGTILIDEDGIVIPGNLTTGFRWA